MQIPNGRSFREELRIGQNLELFAVPLSSQNLFEHLSGADGNRGFFNNDFRPVGDFRNPSRAGFDVLKIRGLAGSRTVTFGGGVDADENDVGVSDMSINFR